MGANEKPRLVTGAQRFGDFQAHRKALRSDAPPHPYPFYHPFGERP
jgi:hypothetical protein